MACLVLADAGARPSQSLRFDQLGVEQGLAQESAQAIAQDATGFMWFGTQAGLVRYDGSRAITYRNQRGNDCSLVDNWVRALHSDAQGRLWVGTRLGLDRYDPARDCFEHVRLAADGDTPTEVGAIAASADGRLWLATPKGLLRLDPERGQARVFGPAHGLPQEPVLALAVDRRDNLWVATRAGVGYLAAGAARFRHHDLDVLADGRRAEPTKLWAIDDGAWVGTTQGLARLQLRSGRIEAVALPAAVAAAGKVNALLLDREGRWWFGTGFDGLARLAADGEELLHYRNDPTDPRSLADNQVIDLHQDRTGTLWVGTWGAGLSRVDLASGGFESYSDRGDEPLLQGNRKVYGITGSGDGVLWLSTRGGGVMRLDVQQRQVRSYRHVDGDPDSLEHDSAIALALGADGRLWLSTDRGLGWLEPSTGRYRAYPLRDFNSNTGRVYAIYRAAGERELWLSTTLGLYRLDPDSGEQTIYRHDPAVPDSLAADFVSSVLQDRRGRLWVATVGGGLDLLEDRAGGRFRHFRHDAASPDSLSSDRVQVLFEDSAGTLWAGTAVGLNRLQEAADGTLRFRIYSMQDGLGSDSIGAIAEGSRGELWISTTAGISRFDPSTWSAHNYTASDGLPDGSYFVGSGFRDGDGTLYFGSLNGLTAIRPERIHGNPHPPRVVITDLLVFNHSVRDKLPEGAALDGSWPVPRGVRLEHALSVFTLEFSALHYASPPRNRYAYRLDGFDKDWNYTDAQGRSATYTNLDPGHYLFRVKAANKDGVWSEAETTFAITVAPPFWARWWFRGGAALLVAGALTSLYAYRVRTLKRQAERLERRVEERTLQLEQALGDLERASLTDPLTGLRNRRFLLRQMEADRALNLRSHEQAARTGASPAAGGDLLFFLIDLDFFKKVNDVHGHAAGDAVLSQVRARLQPVFRESDHLVRWGGEELLVVARNADRGNAGELAERVRAAFADVPFVLDDGSVLDQTCSVGFACMPFLPQHPAALAWTDVVAVADIALYAVKSVARNGWVGIHAGAQLDPGSLRRALRESPGALFERGDLVFHTNLPRAAVAAVIGRQQPASRATGR